MDSILPSKKSCCQVYPNNLKNRDFGLAKAPGFDDHKWVNIRNMDPFMIVKSLELSLKPKTDFSGCLGIKTERYASLDFYCNRESNSVTQSSNRFRKERMGSGLRISTPASLSSSRG